MSNKKVLLCRLKNDISKTGVEHNAINFYFLAVWSYYQAVIFPKIYLSLYPHIFSLQKTDS